MPTRRRVRSVKKTALVYCEGAHDLAFVRHLIKLYADAGMVKFSIKSKQGKGGSPYMLVIEASNVVGSFDKRMVKIDRDRPTTEVEQAEQAATQKNIAICWTKPCIEAMLLSILDGRDYSRFKSKTCKRLFESNHIPANKRTSSRAYESVFSLDIIEAARPRITDLEELVQFVTA